MTTASLSSPRGSASKKHSLTPYHRGSNEPKCHWGILFALQNVYGLNPGFASTYREVAAGFLHYIYADLDHDGVCNLLEYAFNLSPEALDSSSLPEFKLAPQVLNGQPVTYLTVRFLHQLGATNLTYILQGSPDLITWGDLCTAAGTNAPRGAGFISKSGTGYQRQIVACDTVRSESSATARFVRFKLVRH